MKNIIHFEPLTVSNYKIYNTIGAKAYEQHYLHLWPNENATPYIESSFTNKVLEKESKDDNTLLWLINQNQKPIGILKITINSPVNQYDANDALYLDKVYIIKEATGKGVGSKTLQFVMLRAKELNKKVVWLGAMQKGKALTFYIKNGFKIDGETEVPFKEVLTKERAMFILTKEV